MIYDASGNLCAMPSQRPRKRWRRGGGAIVSPPAIQRYFTELNPAFGQYYTIPPITFTGDFEVEIRFSTAVSTDNNVLWAGIYPDEYYLRTQSNGTFLFYSGANSSVFSTGAVNISDNVQHTLSTKLTGTGLELVLDGVSLGTKTIIPTTVANNIAIGRAPNLGRFFSGILSDLSIWEGGDRTTGTLIRDYKIDEDWTENNILVNSAAVLGSDVLDPLAGVTWIDNGDNNYSETVSYGSFLQIGGDIGKAYILEYKDEVGNVSVSDGTTSIALSGSGTAIIYGGTSTPRILASAGSSITLVSLKQADAYGTSINIVESDLYQFDDSSSPHTWTDTEAPLTVIEVGGA